MTALPVIDIDADAPSRAGALLKAWRVHRRMSQLDLSNRAGVSTRHLSFVETGRSQPSRDLLLHLGRSLGMPMRDCNRLLLAAGFAPVFGDAPLNSPEQRDTMTAVQRVLDAHEPWPALVVDRHWNLVLSNKAAGLFIEDVDLIAIPGPLNALRICLHPSGLAPRILNLGAMAKHVLSNLDRQIEGMPDLVLVALRDELRDYTRDLVLEDHDGDDHGLAVTMELRRGEATLRFVNMIATFGSGIDATTSELMIETFLPADDETATALRAAFS